MITHSELHSDLHRDLHRGSSPCESVTPNLDNGCMGNRSLSQSSSFVCFAEVAHEVSHLARRLGLQIPSFRSPPVRADVDRSIRWSQDGSATVAVRVRGRSMAAVEFDVVEGVLQANHLDGPQREEMRTRLALLLAARHSHVREPAA